MTAGPTWPRATAARPSCSPRTSTRTSGRPNRCNYDVDAHTHQWLFEGAATYLSWQALLRQGDLTREDLGEYVDFYRPRRSGLAPLRDHEGEGGDDDLYAKWHLAVRELASGAPGGDRSLLRFCRDVGGGTPWREAFADAFGVGVDPFYARFERSFG